jgi:hypothetical protein
VVDSPRTHRRTSRLRGDRDLALALDATLELLDQVADDQDRYWSPRRRSFSYLRV